MSTETVVRRRASKSIPCPVCYRPIQPGDWTVPADVAGYARRRYVHEKCCPPRVEAEVAVDDSLPRAEVAVEEAAAALEAESKAAVEAAAAGEAAGDGDSGKAGGEASGSGKASGESGSESESSGSGEGESESEQEQEGSGEQEQEPQDESDDLKTRLHKTLLEYLDAYSGNGKEPADVTRVQVGDLPEVKVAGKVHGEFDWVCKLAQARLNIYLVGPTGCGKTHLAKQVADALGLKFSSISCSGGLSEAQLYGRLLPMQGDGSWQYVTTTFVERYTTGGVFLFDEIDAADENTLISINAAISNGYFDIPNRPWEPRAIRHKDFICIAAANTFGTGADRMYCGRNALDGATLDRFRMGTVDLDYDESIEKALCPDKELLKKLHEVRKCIRNHKMPKHMSTRFIQDAYKMKAVGATTVRILKSYLSDWKKDELKKLGNILPAELQDQSVPF